ncbi:U-box domain-containing protein 33 [Hordeum vulgare]|nr:U-box domain-containing protein 33 [Hordeum vulgare]
MRIIRATGDRRHEAEEGEELTVPMPNSVTGSNGAVQWKTPKLSLPPCTLPVRDGLCKVPASQVEEKELKAYRNIEKEEMNTLLNQYLNFCRVSLKIQAETLVIEKNSLANGIIELIDQNHITKLVMGASSFSVHEQMQYSNSVTRFSGKKYTAIISNYTVSI